MKWSATYRTSLITIRPKLHHHKNIDRDEKTLLFNIDHNDL